MCDFPSAMATNDQYRDNRKQMTEPCGLTATEYRDEDRSQVSSELGVLDVRTEELLNRLSALGVRLTPILNEDIECSPNPSCPQATLVPLADRIRNYSDRVGNAVILVNRMLSACEL